VNQKLALLVACVVVAAPLHAQVDAPRRAPRAAPREAPPVIPALPDSTGFGVPVLTVTKAPDGALWVGTYGRGIYVLRPGDSTWSRIVRDTTGRSISFDFVHAFAFPRPGVVWYGTPGNGWGISLDGGLTWKNWTGTELGPEYQYTVPDGILTKGDTVYIGTADGVMVTWDDGQHWEALVDSVGPQTNRLGAREYPVLKSEYVKRLMVDFRGLAVATLAGNQRLARTAQGWVNVPSTGYILFRPRNSLQLGRFLLKGTNCGLVYRGSPSDTTCYANQRAVVADSGKPPRTVWFQRPINPANQPYIDQTYRYGSTFGGTFQPHQGVEFNNPDGTPVRAIGSGVVVWAGPAEQGALTVAIRHDTTITGFVPRSPIDTAAPVRARLFIYSVYYHNSALKVKVGDRVRAGEVISWVGNTGRATNDHLHLEVHASPIDSVRYIVDPNERYPRYTTNPELWIPPLTNDKGVPQSGWVAGQVFDAQGHPVPQAHIFGLSKYEPAETPLVMMETYGLRNHMNPLYQEHFAIGDVPPGDYTLGVEIDGKRVYRKVIVTKGMVTWVVFRP
jgi:murein DD-endopeptidase MepM/ murein hydrolase activator NlpD